MIGPMAAELAQPSPDPDGFFPPRQLASARAEHEHHAQLSRRLLGAIGISWLDLGYPADSSIAFDLSTIDSADGLSRLASERG
jgi:hypothetical protein